MPAAECAQSRMCWSQSALAHRVLESFSSATTPSQPSLRSTTSYSCVRQAAAACASAPWPVDGPPLCSQVLRPWGRRTAPGACLQDTDTCASVQIVIRHSSDVACTLHGTDQCRMRACRGTGRGHGCQALAELAQPTVCSWPLWLSASCKTASSC